MINKIGSQVSFKAVMIDDAVRNSSKSPDNIDAAYKILDDTFTPMGLNVKFSLANVTEPEGAMTLVASSPSSNKNKKVVIGWNPFNFLGEGAIEQFQDYVDRLFVGVKKLGLDTLTNGKDSAITVKMSTKEGLEIPEEYKGDITQWSADNADKYQNAPVKVVIKPVQTGAEHKYIIPAASLYNKITGDYLGGVYIGINGAKRDLERLDELAARYITVYNQGFEAGQKTSAAV